MRNKWWANYNQPWRMRFQEGEAKAGDEGSGHGGAGGGASGTGDEGAGKGDEGAGKGDEGAGKGDEGAGKGDEGAGKEDAAATAAAEAEANKAELTRLKKFEASAAPHLETDPTTGEVRVKAARPAMQWTAEQIAQAQMENSIAEKSAALVELNRSAEIKTIDKFKASDPLFAQNFQKAREKMLTLPAAQRTEQIWERAYHMAAGEAATSGVLEKQIRASERQAVLAEIERSQGITLPAASGTGSGKKDAKPDISKITLTREEHEAAASLVASGMLDSIDDYKENMLILQGGH